MKAYEQMATALDLLEAEIIDVETYEHLVLGENSEYLLYGAKLNELKTTELYKLINNDKVIQKEIKKLLGKS